MKTRNINSRARLGTALAALAIGLTAVAAPAAARGMQPRVYSSGTYRPTNQVLLNVGEGQMINLPRSVASVWTSNAKVADVYVNSPHQINLFGKEMGEATVIATAADGSVVYGAQVRVNQNISSINDIVHAGDAGLGYPRADGRPGRSDQRHRRFARRCGPGRDAGQGGAQPRRRRDQGRRRA